MPGTISHYFQKLPSKHNKVGNHLHELQDEKKHWLNQEPGDSSTNNARCVELGSAQEPLVILDDSDAADSDAADSVPIDRKVSSTDVESPQVARDETITSEGDTSIPGATPISDIPPNSTNPFAQFAYRNSSSSSSAAATTTTTTATSKIAPKSVRPSFTWRTSTTTQSVTTALRGEDSVKRKTPSANDNISRNKRIKKNGTQHSTTTSSTNDNWVPMRQLSLEEQESIRIKWHRFAEPTHQASSSTSSSTSLEVKRYHVFLAARLHARCQEAAVHKAMATLRQAFDNQLTVESMAKADPTIVAQYLTNIQYYNSKAKQMVKASQELLTNFNGLVPEDEHSLLQLTGVGKVFADLLSVVNTRDAHNKGLLDQGSNKADSCHEVDTTD